MTGLFLQRLFLFLLAVPEDALFAGVFPADEAAYVEDVQGDYSNGVDSSHDDEKNDREVAYVI